MKKFLSNTIVQLLIAVIIGLSAGFVVNDAVLEAIVCIKHITGQIIFFSLVGSEMCIRDRCWKPSFA